MLPRVSSHRRKDVPPGYLLSCNVNLKHLCNTMNYGFVDVWHSISQDRRCFAGDGLHLSRKGKFMLQQAILYVVSGRGKLFIAMPEN